MYANGADLLPVETTAALAGALVGSLDRDAPTALAEAHPGIEQSVCDRHPVEALQMLRHSEIDVAFIFRYADAPAEEEGFRLVHIRDDPICLVSQRPDDSIANHRDSPEIGGCARCQEELTSVCRRAGFTHASVP